MFWYVDVLVWLGLSTFWSVDVLVCRHFGLSTLWSVRRRFGLSTLQSVDVLVCRHFGIPVFRFVDVFVVDVSVSRRFDQLPTKGSTLTHQILFINMVIILQSTYQNGFLQWHFSLSHSPCVLLLKYNLHFTLHRHYIVNIFPTFKHFNPSFSPLMRRIKYRTCLLPWSHHQRPLAVPIHRQAVHRDCERVYPTPIHVRSTQQHGLLCDKNVAISCSGQTHQPWNLHHTLGWNLTSVPRGIVCHKRSSFEDIHYNDIIMGAMVLHYQRYDCLLNHLFWWRSKKTSKLCVTGLCAGNSAVTSEFPAQRASNVENVSIWWRHHAINFLIISL